MKQLVAIASFLALTTGCNQEAENKEPQAPHLRYGPNSVLNDQDLIDFASQKFDDSAKANLEAQLQVLGSYKGKKVVVDYPCGDICPDYTTRIIHFDLPADSRCITNGGVIAKRLVPMSIATVEKDFCVPPPLAKLGPKLGE